MSDVYLVHQQSDRFTGPFTKVDALTALSSIDEPGWEMMSEPLFSSYLNSHSGPTVAVEISQLMNRAIQLYDIVTAAFRPQRTDNLTAGAAELVGKRLTWCASWLITEEDGGDYIGDYAMMPIDKEPMAFGWVPQRDLSGIVRQRRA